MVSGEGSTGDWFQGSTVVIGFRVVQVSGFRAVQVIGFRVVKVIGFRVQYR